MKILKASAGSGKTFRLSKTYRDILLDSEDKYAYRHILAVTFTNKATAEMKARILKDLASEAGTNPKARRVLTDILHDYSAFAVSTIDKFFQRALKAFSREIGHFASYQIELDRDSVIAETMDRILDSLTADDRELLQWIRYSVNETVESGFRLHLEDGLYKMGALLKNEEHRTLLEATGYRDSEIFSKERLAKVRKECRRVISDFEKKCKAFGIEPKAKGKAIEIPGVRKMKAEPRLQDLFDSDYDSYNTAVIVDKLVFSLGLAGEFYARFDELLKEKNLMCLDESNTILKDIIRDSEAPFVYEKLGVRYRDFLLDEFQDTSGIQWENFLPLLKESESGDENGPAHNLVVGDVKQSIYRWRNSDWRLLGEKVEEVFPEAVSESMRDNWRSSPAVVAFNSRFFDWLAPRVGAADMYSDVGQTPKRDDGQKGHVRISFCDDQQKATLDSILSVKGRGALYKDMAVLVRGNEEGKSIADYLVSNGIPVISNDSLSLKSSVTVRRLVSLLGCMEKPGDAVSTYLGQSMNVTFPEGFISPVDLCEALMRELMNYDEAAVRRDSMYVQAFMDELQSWTETGGNDIRGFLSHWEDGKFFLNSPEGQDAVTIITVHKSKGLEFPHVIFPYADKVIRYRAGIHWCRLSTAGTTLDPVLDGIYPVELTSSTQRSLFAADYDNERKMQDIDNLNIFYVALTRAVKSLHVIAKVPTKKCKESVEAGKCEFTNYSEALFGFCNGNTEYEYGEPYDFSRMEREKQSGVMPRLVEYSSTAIGNRLSPSDDASDFFGEDGTVGAAASGRLMGVALHNILSSVNVPGDLERAVRASVLAGELTEAQGRDALDLLGRRIASHSGWFCSEGRNEVSVIGSDGRIYRPDRVIVSGDAVTVVDYKFGAKEESYARQVGRYARLYKQMGYPNVKAYIWYVPSDEAEEVVIS